AIEAYALPGAPGRIVVSGRLLDALDDRGQAALLAHEQAHLAARHHLFTTVAHLAAAANPLLLPVARAVDYTVERWADERADRHRRSPAGGRHHRPGRPAHPGPDPAPPPHPRRGARHHRNPRPGRNPRQRQESRAAHLTGLGRPGAEAGGRAPGPAAGTAAGAAGRGDAARP